MSSSGGFSLFCDFFVIFSGIGIGGWVYNFCFFSGLEILLEDSFLVLYDFPERNASKEFC